MKKLLAVFGATGNQGGSVVRFVLQDSQLSEEYDIRIIVRNKTKSAARGFAAEGVEVIEADIDDDIRLQVALADVHSVFVLTNFFDHLSKAKEIEQSKRIADIAVLKGVDFLIYSSLPSATQISNGVYTHVQHFDGKAEAEEYIRKLPIKSAFFLPAAYMQNFLTSLRPRPMGDGTHAIISIVAPDTQVPMIDVERDSGKYVGAMLADPAKFWGRRLHGAASCYTFAEAAGSLSRATDSKVIYQQITDDEFKANLPEAIREEVVEMLALFRDFGLFGPDQEAIVAADVQLARQRPTSLDEFFTRHMSDFGDLRSS